MNWKNVSENLIITIVVIISTAFVTYKATIASALRTNQQSIEGLRPALVEAIKKETTAIRNDIKVDIDKIKKSDSININIKQDPSNNLEQIKTDSPNCIPEGYTLIKIENLTRRQKKRMNIN